MTRLPALLLLALLPLPLRPAPPDLWGLAANSKVPLDIEVLSTEERDGIRVDEIYYTGELISGKPLRVYGFLGRPLRPHGKVPGILQLHGGGGTAAKAGAVSLARDLGAVGLNIDWSGQTSRAKRVTLTSALPDPKLFGDPRYVAEDLSDFSARHLVRALSKGIDLLAAQPEVDPGKLGVFGGSWGGFLSLLVAGLDARVHFAVSGYGAGAFRDTWSNCSRLVYTQGERRAEFWLDNVDPVLRADRIRGPVALQTASNEVHFWLNSAAATFRKLPKSSRILISPNTAHTLGPEVVWSNAEWLRHAFGDGPAWPDVLDFRFDGRAASWKVAATGPVSSATLYFAPGREKWPSRAWLPVAAKLENGRYAAHLPPWLAGVEGDAYPLVTEDGRRSVSALPLHCAGLAPREWSRRRPDPGLIDDFSLGIGLWTLPFDNRQKAKLARDGHALTVTEARGEDADIQLQTHALVMASALLSPTGALEFSVDAGGAAVELTLDLFQQFGLKDQRKASVKTSLAPRPGFQSVRVPLARFAGLSDWGAVDALTLQWKLRKGSTTRFTGFRLAAVK